MYYIRSFYCGTGVYNKKNIEKHLTYSLTKSSNFRSLPGAHCVPKAFRVHFIYLALSFSLSMSSSLLTHPLNSHVFNHLHCFYLYGCRHHLLILTSARYLGVNSEDSTLAICLPPLFTPGSLLSIVRLPASLQSSLQCCHPVSSGDRALLKTNTIKLFYHHKHTLDGTVAIITGTSHPTFSSAGCCNSLGGNNKKIYFS